MRTRLEYKEIAKAKVASSRNVVISGCSQGGFTIAQQLVANEGNKTTTVFMKGAFHVEDISGLYELRDAINLAIQVTEERNNSESNSDKWDDEWDDE